MAPTVDGSRFLYRRKRVSVPLCACRCMVCSDLNLLVGFNAIY